MLENLFELAHASGARWLFMKRAHKLSDAERWWLWSVFEASVDELRRAWVLKELSRRSTTNHIRTPCETSGRKINGALLLPHFLSEPS